LNELFPLFHQTLTIFRHGFISSNEDVDYPNLMFHFLPVAIRYDDTLPSSRHGYQVHVGLMYTDARGSVKIKLTDPAVDSLSVLVGAI